MLQIYFNNKPANIMHYRFGVVSPFGNDILNECIKQNEDFMTEQGLFFKSLFNSSAFYVADSSPHLVVARNEFEDRGGKAINGTEFRSIHKVSIEGSDYHHVVAPIGGGSDENKERTRDIRRRLYLVMKNRILEAIKKRIGTPDLLPGFTAYPVEGKLLEPLLFLVPGVIIVGVPMYCNISRTSPFIHDLVSPSDVRKILIQGEEDIEASRGGVLIAQDDAEDLPNPALVLGEWGFSQMRLQKLGIEKIV